jgi:uncharacterized protein (UPF0264 family)
MIMRTNAAQATVGWRDMPYTTGTTATATQGAAVAQARLINGKGP